MTISIENSDLYRQRRLSSDEPVRLSKAAANRAVQGSAGESDFNSLLEGLLATEAAQQNAAGRSSSAAVLSASAAPQPWGAFGSAFLGSSKPTEYEELIQQASEAYGVQSSLVKAVIEAESSFNPKAVSSAGAKGLMQLMDATGAGLGVTDPFDPAQNIAGGTQYLSNLLVRYNGNQSVALAAYNAGSGRVDRLGIRTDQDLASKLRLLPEETQKYVARVLDLQAGFANE
ncbi:Transglycosylase SLT domain-containing protein [Paenibacillus sp. UNCCL117]|uniref:lytic transglycosylase domain-containing protein n=1 Tax=unclassified Paenibacillus TaxID=185978 RepID=UPI0008884DCE|nr:MULTISPECIES: lytic transglycosylase domain-containing protein [unclassified Paenibacillus]SDC73008.1 Transglycosylase SLT domain-containing protein [Paenibacillus sp. cl123]SFW24920.1 Transglycosylase SLT domain-containing protein [Paenibacillus sp. UNCCL117]